MSILPQQFGPLCPGLRGLVASGTTAATATLLYNRNNIFEIVVDGGMSRLPGTGSSMVEITVFNQDPSNDLLVIPDEGDQIWNLGPSAAATVSANGGVATFVCVDSVLQRPRQWWVK